MLGKETLTLVVEIDLRDLLHDFVLVEAVFKPLVLQDFFDKYGHLAIGLKVDLARLFHYEITAMILALETEYSLINCVYGAGLSFR